MQTDKTVWFGHGCNSHPNVTLVSRLLPETTTGDSSTAAWSAWHLLKFIEQHVPNIGVTEELLTKIEELK